MTARGLPVAERFWAKVAREGLGPDDCWAWLAGGIRRGYGTFNVGGGRGVVLAHRFAWELTHGDPGPLHVLHRCDRPPCVNPAHLFLGTNADNVADRVAKGGTRVGTKLSSAQVADIRRRFAPGLGPALAREFGVSSTHVYDIVAGRYRMAA